MIRITYSAAQSDLAETISADLSDRLEAASPLLIVLVSRQSATDPLVQAEIERATSEREPVLPILLDDVELPAPLAIYPPLDFRRGYDRQRLINGLSQVTMIQVDVRKANRRALVFFGSLALIIFCVALISMIGGVVAFPVAEYNEEATFQAQWIDGLIRQTLEYVQPRSTADGQNFAATYEAAPTRLHFYIRGTATAMAREN